MADKETEPKDLNMNTIIDTRMKTQSFTIEKSEKNNK